MAQAGREKLSVDVSFSSLLRCAGLGLLCYLLYLIRDVVGIVAIAAFIAITLDPLLGRLQRRGIRRPLGVSLFLALVIGVLAAAGYCVVPLMVAQASALIEKLPLLASRLSEFGQTPLSDMLRQAAERFSSELAAAAGRVVSAAFSMLNAVASGILILILAFYFLAEDGGVSSVVSEFIPARHRDAGIALVKRCSGILGNWLAGQASLMVIIAGIDTAILALLGIPYAVVVGILSGLLEIVPVAGPIAAGLVALLVAAGSGVPIWKLVAVAAAYVGVQQVENAFLVPRIMQRAVGLSPVLVIVAILIGGKLLGAAGVVIAVPVAAAVRVFLDEFAAQKAQAA